MNDIFYEVLIILCLVGSIIYLFIMNLRLEKVNYKQKQELFELKLPKKGDEKSNNEVHSIKIKLDEVKSMIEVLCLPEYKEEDFEKVENIIHISTVISGSFGHKLKSETINEDKFRIGKAVYTKIDNNGYETDYYLYERSY